MKYPPYTHTQQTELPPIIKKEREVKVVIETVQRKLREKLVEELWEDRENLEEAFLHPELYSYKFQSYKEKYLDRLIDLQRILNELSILEKNMKNKKK